MTQSEFINKYYNFAASASKDTGISPILILSQAFIESGRGKSLLATKYNNFFGHKAKEGWQGRRIILVTKEQDKAGKEFTIRDAFRIYNSPFESFKEHINFLQKNPRYRKAGLFNNPNNYALQADSLQKAGYATDVNYARKLKDIGNSLVRNLKNISPIKAGAAIVPLVLLFLLTKKIF